MGRGSEGFLVGVGEAAAGVDGAERGEEDGGEDDEDAEGEDQEEGEESEGGVGCAEDFLFGFFWLEVCSAVYGREKEHT